MESEDVFACVYVDAVVLEHKVVTRVQFLAACDVHDSQAKIGDDDGPQGLSSNGGTADVKLLKVRQVLAQRDHSLVLQIAAAQKADLAQELALG